MRWEPLPDLPRNPFEDRRDPADFIPLTTRIPDDCIHSLTREAVALKTEMRLWLVENVSDYACRTIQRCWLPKTDEIRSSYVDAVPYITFVNEKDFVLFKLWWS